MLNNFSAVFVGILSVTSAVGETVFPSSSKPYLNGIKDIIGVIGDLEKNKDPKCYATASRLENFMYGTPLTDAARFKKIVLQKRLILEVWEYVSGILLKSGKKTIAVSALDAALKAFNIPIADTNKDIHFKPAAYEPLVLKQEDIRQYSSVAYSLRAILGVQQDVILSGKLTLLPLDKESIARLKESMDLITLLALQIADQRARKESRYHIDEKDFLSAWQLVVSVQSSSLKTLPVNDENEPEGSADLSIIKQIIDQKLAAYAVYNKISSPVFVRNIQVYFARYRWPVDPKKNRQLKAWFNEIMIGFTKDAYLGSQAIARSSEHTVIRIDDVKAYVDKVIPHYLNEYEDAVFFPRLQLEDQIEIASYDMDAFRDSGLHWQYLRSAVDDVIATNSVKLEIDPFAAELLVESVAQFGVLLLREAGAAATKGGKNALTPQDFEKAGMNIQRRLNKYPWDDMDTPTQMEIASSAVEQKTIDGYFFQDITGVSGVNFKHSSSDWLNRLIRGYTVRDGQVAVLAVPPAFGGAGVAAEDINGDGKDDLLLLSGLGNKLYLNQGKGRFKDITDSAGLGWQRDDGLPGEPRQPIIADFNNDGLPDIFITYVDDDHRMYMNIGNSKFKDVTNTARLGGKSLVAGPATVADFDNDGLLDIYIGYFGQYINGIKPTLARRNFNGLPNKLFKNLGSFHFKDISGDSGVENNGWTQALTHTDFDRDGKQDLIVGNDFGINAFYKNTGNGKFINIASKLGVDKPSYTMNVGITDLNDDLFPDVYISNIVTMDKDQKYVLPDKNTGVKFDARKMANMRVVEANDLFLSVSKDNKLSNYEISRLIGRGATSTGWAWGAGFFDVDNDSDDDLYVVNGMNEFALYSSENPYFKDGKGVARDIVLPQSNRDANVFFINDKGRLINVSERSGVNLLGNSRAVVYTDIDQDGDLDMVLNNYHSKAVVYRNNAEQLKNHWLSIKLVGNSTAGSNRDAIGAKIIVTTSTGKRIWREIRAGEAYLTMYPKTQYFGLGSIVQADINIEWPNGEKMIFEGIDADYHYTIDQTSHSLGRWK
jgi:hypothetical protein